MANTADMVAEDDVTETSEITQPVMKGSILNKQATLPGRITVAACAALAVFQTRASDLPAICCRCVFTFCLAVGLLQTAFGADDAEEWIPLGPATATVLRSGDPIYRISASGKYYLTNDVKHISVRPAPVSKGEKMDTIDVTVDLRGHSITNISTGDYRLFECGQSEDLGVLTYCTLTNSAEKTSYLDGCRKKFEGEGRGILNRYTGVMHLGGNIVIRRCLIGDYPETYKGSKNWWGAGICNHGTFYMTGGAVGEAETAVSGICNSTPHTHGGGIFNGQAQTTTRPCSRQTRFYMTGGSVQYCKSGKHGGGISNQYWDSLLVVGGEGKGVVISHNTSPSGAGVMTGNTSTLHLTNNVEISYNKATGTEDTCSGGGISVGSGGEGYGGGVNQLFIYNCNIVSNTAENLGGGGIYMRGVSSGHGRIEMHDGRIAYNTTTGVGGGIHTQGPVLLTGGVIEENSSDSNGGGLCIDVDSGNNTDWSQAFTMEGGCIRNNSARQGAGVYTVNEVYISGGAISNNHASAHGGGVCIDQQRQGGKTSKKPFKLTGGLIANNIAEGRGGGFAVFLADKGEVLLENGDVCDNRAGGQGGGLWLMGTKSENVVTLVGGSIFGNVAEDGGGLYMTNLAINATGGNIVSNSATRGGGVCLGVGGKATFDGTLDISHNVATNLGGAVAMNKSTELTISNGVISCNVAQMGGAIHMLGGAKLNIHGVDMFNNRAVYRPDQDRVHVGSKGNTVSTNWPTAWHTERYDLCSGVGGGIYLGKGVDGDHLTILDCPESESAGLVGVYSNVADRAGNEIVSAGAWTKVVLPKSELKDALGRRLGWFEDYYTGDTKYPHLMDPERTPQGMRYADAMRQNIQVQISTDVAGTPNNYLCLTLGYLVDRNVKSLWITDHADAGPGKVHLAFQPIAEDMLDMATWIPRAQKKGLVHYVAADTEAELKDAPPKNDFTFRGGTGTQDAQKGWCWITMPATNKFYKIVIDKDKQDE